MQPLKLQKESTTRRRFLQASLASAAAGLILPPAKALAQSAGAPWARDPRRPQYHLLPAANWMNDPNAPIYWQGSYHMFFQYNPNGAFWGDMHWAHAISPDMVHWRHLPVALAPTPGSPDAQGCFSGTAVVDGDRVAAIYTGVVTAPPSEATIRDGNNNFRETQCLATSTGDLTRWEKAPQPIIAAPPPGMTVSGFRDPSPWRQGDAWYMVVGSGVRGKGGAILLYRSTDLHHWEYRHVLISGRGGNPDAVNPVDSGDMWECPDLFALSGKHVLIYSAQGKAFWQSGDLDTTQWLFHPQQEGVLDYGDFYAPKTQLDRSGDRILWGWIQETRPLEEYRAAGWAGMMSLPRVLTLSREGRLQVRVAPAVNRLRRPPRSLVFSAEEDRNRQSLAAMSLEDGCGEIRVATKDRIQPFALSLTGEGIAAPLLTVRYNPSRPEELLLDGKPIPLRASPAAALSLNIYVDGSVIEVFLDDQAAYTRRFYYPQPSAPAISVKVEKTTSLTSFIVNQLSPISPDRLTT